MSALISYSSIKKQKSELLRIVQLNPNIKELLETIKFPNDHEWYVAAGCVNQTVWNYLTDREITNGIEDYDIVYWDEDTSYEAEDKVIKNIEKQIAHLEIEVDIKNQARVPIWFEDKYGYKIDPYKNLVHAISTWPATATCVGVTRKEKDFHVAAPYGLSDLFNMVLRINQPTAIKELTDKKVDKWTSKWPELKLVS
jgi:hypothetical protein